ncbi:MAG: LysM peptidoglycan-binding domain-containing M23 family metallopeptidase [Pseudomonadota bacterium]
MPTLRRSLLPATSLALVSAAAIAVLIDIAHAQDEGAPVRYGTDPGYAGEGPQVRSYRGKDAPAPRGDIQHTVRPGETVYRLGRVYGVSPKQIIAKNRMVAPYPLAVGQTILIPMGPEAVRSGPPQVVVAQPLPPVSTPQPIQASLGPAYGTARTYVVQPKDTLYSISRRFGLSVAELAAANRLARPYTISIDQRLVIPAPASLPAQAPAQIAAAEAGPDPDALDRKMIEETLTPQPLPKLDERRPFDYPVSGPVVVKFGDVVNGKKSDGINITAPIGAPVRAAADGEVVYRGSELEGYGKLLLVKHDDGWVSAYAHTDAILVDKGDLVRQGQIIAKVGRSGTVDSPQVHFQLRKDLQPLDPIAAIQNGYGSQTLTAVRNNR